MYYSYLKFQFVFVFCILLSNAKSAIFYVTENGNGDFSGVSWSNASKGVDLQSIIDNSVDGDQIWVGKGKYFTSYSNNRQHAFRMKNNVAIYGNFEGTESSFDQRKMSEGLFCVLSAEIGDTLIKTDNGYHVISNNNLNRTAVIDGFLIQDAYDDREPTLTDGLGGGIYNDGSNSSECSPTIRNCIITNNYSTYGGGVFNNGYNFGKSSPFIENCIIQQNTALAGAGLDNFGLLNGDASPTIINCIFYENTANYRAGGMYCWGGNDGKASPSVTNSLFVNNIAVEGGAVVSDQLNSSNGNSGNSDPSFYNCIFWNNTASTLGENFFLLGNGSFTAVNNLINLDNQTELHVVSDSSRNNFKNNPLFIDELNPEGKDGVWLTIDDGFQLSEKSPCIDAGISNQYNKGDILSTVRKDSIVDIGPYEFLKEENTASLINVNVNSKISIFPNPTNSIFEINLSEAIDLTEFQITNIQGQIIESGQIVNDKMIFSLQNQESGVYLFSVPNLGLRFPIFKN